MGIPRKIAFLTKFYIIRDKMRSRSKTCKIPPIHGHCYCPLNNKSKIGIPYHTRTITCNINNNTVQCSIVHGIPYHRSIHSRNIFNNIICTNFFWFWKMDSCFEKARHENALKIMILFVWTFWHIFHPDFENKRNTFIVVCLERQLN